MSHGPKSVFAFTMAATAGSATVDVTRSWAHSYLQISTYAASASALDVYCSPDGGDNYYQLRVDVAATSTVQPWSFVVAASAMSLGAIVPLPGGFQNYKIVASDSAPTAAINFNLICGA